MGALFDTKGVVLRVRTIENIIQSMTLEEKMDNFL